MPSNTFPEEVVDRQKFENGEAVDLGIREPNSLPENMSNLELNGKDLTLNSAILFNRLATSCHYFPRSATHVLLRLSPVRILSMLMPL